MRGEGGTGTRASVRLQHSAETGFRATLPPANQHHGSVYPSEMTQGMQLQREGKGVSHNRGTPAPLLCSVHPARTSWTRRQLVRMQLVTGLPPWASRGHEQQQSACLNEHERAHVPMDGSASSPARTRCSLCTGQWPTHMFLALEWRKRGEWMKFLPASLGALLASSIDAGSCFSHHRAVGCTP